MNYPDLYTIRNYITDIGRINRKDSNSYLEIYDILKNGIRLIPALTTTLEAKDNISFSRSRIHLDNEVEFTTVDDFSYRKDKTKIEKYSRCNIPHQQIFYCSIDRVTSYSESLAIKKDRLKNEYASIGLWKLKKDINVGIIAHPFKKCRHTDYDKDFGDKIDFSINRDCKELEKEVREILYFFTIEFRYLVYNHLDYMVTSAISNLYFENLDAIIYPSVPFMGQGFNLAIKKELIDNKSVSLEHAMIEKFNRLEYLKISQDMSYHRQTDKIDYDKNEIKWS